MVPPQVLVFHILLPRVYNDSLKTEYNEYPDLDEIVGALNYLEKEFSCVVSLWHYFCDNSKTVDIGAVLFLNRLQKRANKVREAIEPLAVIYRAFLDDTKDVDGSVMAGMLAYESDIVSDQSKAKEAATLLSDYLADMNARILIDRRIHDEKLSL